MVVYDHCSADASPSLRSLKDYVLANPQVEDLRFTEVDFSEDLSGTPTLYLEYRSPTGGGSYTIDVKARPGTLYSTVLTDLTLLWASSVGENRLMRQFLRALERELVVRVDRGSDRSARYQTLTHCYTVIHDVGGVANE